MNREIKFRGMDISGEFYYGNLAILKCKLDHVKPGHYISNKVGVPFAYEVRPETVGQYTGLKDSKGKEIYEGDILRFLDYFGKSCHGIVEFENLQWCINGYALHSTYQFRCGNKIIGNVFENSDLLETIRYYEEEPVKRYM